MVVVVVEEEEEEKEEEEDEEEEEEKEEEEEEEEREKDKEEGAGVERKRWIRWMIKKAGLVWKESWHGHCRRITQAKDWRGNKGRTGPAGDPHGCGAGNSNEGSWMPVGTVGVWYADSGKGLVDGSPAVTLVNLCGFENRMPMERSADYAGEPRMRAGRRGRTGSAASPRGGARNSGPAAAETRRSGIHPPPTSTREPSRSRAHPESPAPAARPTCSPPPKHERKDAPRQERQVTKSGKKWH